VTLTRLRRPRDGKRWRVEKRGGASDGLAVDCSTLEFAMLWFRILLREDAAERGAAQAGEEDNAARR
jgi:hypothetical protein